MPEPIATDRQNSITATGRAFPGAAFACQGGFAKLNEFVKTSPKAGGPLGFQAAFGGRF